MLRVARLEQGDNYRQLQEVLHDMLDGSHAALMCAQLAASHPGSYKEWNRLVAGIPLPNAHRYLGVLAMMQADLAVVFQQPGETTLVNGKGEQLPEDDQQTIQWRRDEAEISEDGIWPVLEQLDAWTVSFATLLAQVKWVRVDELDRGRVRWEPIAPYQCQVFQSVRDPSNLARDAAVSVELPQPPGAAGSPEPTLFQTWVRDSVFLHDEAGRIITDQTAGAMPGNVNPYRTHRGAAVHPFVVFRDGPVRRGQFWLPERQDWIAFQLWVNTHLIDERHALKFGAFGVPVLRGGEAEGIQGFGPEKPVRLMSGDADFFYRQAGTNFDALRKAVDDALRRFARTSGLPADFWSVEGATRNFNAKMVDYNHLLMRRRKRMPRLMAGVDRLWAIHKLIGNHHVSEDPTRTMYKDGTRLVVRPAPLLMPVDPATDAVRRDSEYRYAVSTPVDELMRRDMISRQDAESIVERNRKFAREFGSVAEPMGDAVFSKTESKTGTETDASPLQKHDTPPNLEGGDRDD